MTSCPNGSTPYIRESTHKQQTVAIGQDQVTGLVRRLPRHSPIRSISTPPVDQPSSLDCVIAAWQLEPRLYTSLTVRDSRRHRHITVGSSHHRLGRRRHRRGRRMSQDS